jgi:hypothetical protein
MDTFVMISGIASIIGIPLAIIIALIQTSRLNKLKEREYRDIWKLVKDVRSLMGRTKTLSDNKEDEGAHEIAKSIFRHLIKNAVNLEQDFNEKTIDQWTEDDKIADTDWQRGIAKSYLKR